MIANRRNQTSGVVKDIWMQSSLLGFCLLAYGITWLCWLPIVFAREAWIRLPASEEWFATLGQFGPFVAAVLCTAWNGGMGGLRELLGRLLIWRVGVVWFGIALLLPPVCMICAIVAHIQIFGQPSQLTFAGDVSTLLPHLVITLVTGGPLGEEPGWRGYALPRLRARLHAIPASALLGVVWACWHLPLWLVAEVPSSFLFYLFGVLPLTYLFTWLWDHTRGSVLIALLFHASINTFLVRLPIFPAWGEWTALLWAIAIAVAIVEWQRGKRPHISVGRADSTIV
jgi:membrane protease YdiL (CAAX protease family)